MFRIFLFCVTVLLLIACEATELSPLQYLKWLNKKDNGLVFKSEGQRFRYSLKYRPTEEMVLREIDETYNRPTFDSLQQEFNGAEYYLLKLESLDKSPDATKAGLTAENEYYERLNYLNFNFQNDIAIVVNNDTSMCSLYHFERNYGTAPYLNIMLAFPAVDTAFLFDREILIYSRIEPEPQIIRFDVPKKNIQNIPKLKI